MTFISRTEIHVTFLDGHWVLFYEDMRKIGSLNSTTLEMIVMMRTRNQASNNNESPQLNDVEQEIKL